MAPAKKDILDELEKEFGDNTPLKEKLYQTLETLETIKPKEKENTLFQAKLKKECRAWFQKNKKRNTVEKVPAFSQREPGFFSFFSVLRVGGICVVSLCFLVFLFPYISPYFLQTSKESSQESNKGDTNAPSGYASDIAYEEDIGKTKNERGYRLSQQQASSQYEDGGYFSQGIGGNQMSEEKKEDLYQLSSLTNKQDSKKPTAGSNKEAADGNTGKGSKDASFGSGEEQVNGKESEDPLLLFKKKKNGSGTQNTLGTSEAPEMSPGVSSGSVPSNNCQYDTCNGSSGEGTPPQASVSLPDNTPPENQLEMIEQLIVEYLSDHAYTGAYLSGALQDSTPLFSPEGQYIFQYTDPDTGKILQFYVNWITKTVWSPNFSH